MKYAFVLLLTLFTMSVSAQEINKKIEDQFKHKQIMLNNCSREGLVNFPEFKDSYDSYYEQYQIDSVSINKLKPLVKSKQFKVILGTWCGDSKLQVPHFIKIADALNIDEKNIHYIAVDGEKKAESGLLDGLNIERVPTFIITDKKGIEIGRITESPRKTLELDLVEILSPKK